VKILDFGIAKAAAMARQVDTQTGRVRGKLAYLAPEQVRGDEVDGRSDVFALGVVLWEMLTGRRLFAGENEFQTMRNVLSGPVILPSVQRTEVPGSLDAIVARALERDLARRFPSAQAMAEELELYLRDAPCSSRALPSLLDGLFGEDLGQQAGLSPPAPAAPEPAPVPPADVAAADGASWTQGAALPARRRPRGRSMVVLLASVTLLACFGWAARVRQRRLGAARATQVLASAPATVAVPAVPAVPAPAPAAAVAVTIESTPPGADVVGERDVVLGVTPLSMTVPRSTEAMRLRLRKDGFAMAEHTIVPDRAQTLRAALQLLDEPEPTAQRRSHSHHGEKASDDRLTIDPFK
jgi:hypothetical protein